MATVTGKQPPSTRIADTTAGKRLHANAGDKPTGAGATTAADSSFPVITADERDDATHRSISRSTRTIGADRGHSRGDPPLPQGQGGSASLYAAGDDVTPAPEDVLDARDGQLRQAHLAARAVVHAADGAHGVEHALHLTEQTGHAIETTHHLRHAQVAQAEAKGGAHHGGHHRGGLLLGGAVSVALIPGATYFAAKDVKKAIDDTTAENVTMAAGSVGFATSLTIGAAKSGMALAKVGARFTPGLNVAAAAADAVWAAGVMADSKASTSKKVAAGIAALGSAVSATNIPIASQLGAAVATGGTLLSTFL